MGAGNLADRAVLGRQIYEGEVDVHDRHREVADRHPADRVVELGPHVVGVQSLVLDRARQRLASGAPADETLAWLARNLTNKLTHAPTVQLRQAGFDDRGDLLDAARELLGIKPS